MGWLANCSEAERAAVLAKLAGRAYLSTEQLVEAQNTIQMKRKQAKLIKVGDAEAWVFFTKDDGIIVACRGTEPTKFADIAADLKTIPVRHERAGRVHQGFKEYTDLVYPEILEVVQQARTAKEKKGNREFRQHLEGCDIGAYIRYVNNNDIVPRVPPSVFTFVHGGKLNYINHAGLIRSATTWQIIKDGFRGIWAAIKKFQFFDFVRDHGMPNYIKYTSLIEKNDK